MEKGRCTSCNREIIWSTSPSGAKLPLDARPVTAYFLVEHSGLVGPQALAVKAYIEEAMRKQEAIEQSGGPVVLPALYISHFLTCPTVEQHRPQRP